MSKTRLSDAIQDYDHYRLSDGIAANTRVNEQGTLKQFLKKVGDLQLASLREHHMTDYFTERGKTVQASTLRLDMSRINVFLKWARNTRRMPRDLDPLAGRRGPRVVKKERRRIHVSKFPHLLEVAESRCARDRMLVALGLYSLLRDQEMLSIRLRDVDLDSGTLFVRVHKAAEEDTLGISPALDRELRRWLRTYQDTCGPLQPDWFLIPARKTHITNNGLVNGGVTEYLPHKSVSRSYRIVGPVLKAFGFPVADADGESNREGAHTLRRSGARALYDLWVEEGNIDALNMVRVTLHHADLKMTQHYIGLKEDRKTRNDLIHTVRYPFESSNVVSIERSNGESQNRTDVVRQG